MYLPVIVKHLLNKASIVTTINILLADRSNGRSYNNKKLILILSEDERQIEIQTFLTKFVPTIMNKVIGTKTVGPSLKTYSI